MSNGEVSHLFDYKEEDINTSRIKGEFIKLPEFAEADKITAEDLKGEFIKATPEQLKEGVKLDVGKLRYDLLSATALEEVVKVLTFGSQKYDDRNWEKGMKYSRLYAAMQRHANAFWKGEDIDPESDCHHMAAVAFYALAIIHHSKFRKEFDDRIEN